MTNTGGIAVPVVAAAGHGWGLAVFPLVGGAIALVFGAQLTRRFVARRRPYEAAWAAALLMFSVASFAMFLGVVAGWTAAEFRTYYLLGAVLNVPYLFLGEVYVLSRRQAWANGLLAVLLAATTFAVWEVATAPLHGSFLDGVLPLGRDVFGAGSLPHRLAQYYSYPAYFLLLGGLVWSAAQMRGQPHLRRRVAGTLWIALGATIVAIGSGVGGVYHLVEVFAVSLAAGVAVMYWGFLEASRPLSV